MIVVAALYKFVRLEDYQDIKPRLEAVCQNADIKGTLLLAREGINGTVAGTRAGIDQLNAFFSQDARFSDLEYKESSAKTMPFHRMKVRLKKEIVTIGISSVDPTEQVGTYLDSEEWNALLQDPEVLLLDTRNDYEVQIGTFKGAINPKTETFREFPDYVQQHFDPQKHKKVAMFCTGGIRCEKASSYMLQAGFENVYHLKGGILKYLENTPQEKSLWEGECFVFDERVAIGHGLALSEYEYCRSCRYPLNAVDRASPLYELGVSCPHCHDTLSEKKIKRNRARQYQMELAEKRHTQHIGAQHRKNSPAA